MPTVVSSGQTLSVDQGQTISGADVQSGGRIDLYYGSVISTLIESGGLVEVLNFAPVVVVSGSIIYGVENTNSSFNAVLEPGGVLSTSLAINPVTFSGSTISGGTVAFTEATGTKTLLQSTLDGHSTVVQSGPGTLTVTLPYSGNAVISAGTLDLAAGTVTNYRGASISFAPNASATLRLGDNIDSSTVVSGLVSGDAVDFATLPFVSNVTPSSAVTADGYSQLVITEGAQTRSISLSNIPGATFRLASDGTGGTLLTETAGAPVVLSGQTLVVSSGQSSSGVIVNAVGTLDVLSGGRVVSAGVTGTELVSGGTDSATTVLSGGTLTVFKGGQTTGSIINFGGTLTVSSGGLAVGGSYYNAVAGSLLVAAGGVASSLRLSDTGYITSRIVSGGSAVNTSIVGGTLTVEGVTSTVIDSATGVTSTVVVSAGSATGTVVGELSVLTLSAGGVTAGTTLVASTSEGPDFRGRYTYFAGGTEIVSSGGVASGTLVSAGAFQFVGSGGVAVGTLVSSGGQQTINAGGVASGTTGFATIDDEGTLAYAVSAGVTSTLSGAVYGSGTLVQSGPGTLVLSGGNPGNVGTFAGTAVLSAGTLELTTATAAGYAVIRFAAGAAGATLRIDGPAGPTNTISGYAAGDVIDLVGLAYTGNTSATATGSSVIVTENGISETLKIAGAAGQVLNLAADGHGGTMLSNQPVAAATFVDYVYSGQTISSVELLPGDAAFIFAGGTALSTFVAGGPLVTFGTTSGSVLQSGGNQFVKAGTDTAATVSAGAILWVSGGVDIGATVYGLEAVYSGVASASTVRAGGGITVAGGVASGAVVSSGGVVVISGGIASGANVSASGNLFLVAGSDVGTVVSSGGLVTDSGGIDTGATVLGGGEIAAAAHGVISGATVQSGGTLLLLKGGIQSGATLLSGGQLDLGYLVYGSGGSTSYNSASHVLSVTERGTTVTQTLSGDYTGLRFVDSADANGYSIIKAVAVLPPPITVSSGQTVSQSVLRGLETVLSGGQVIFTDVEAYGTLRVAGGDAYEPYLNTSGSAVLLSGTMEGTTINSGAILQVTGGVETAGQVFSGGMEFVTGSGVTVNTTVYSGATLVVQAGGMQSNTILLAGSLDLRDFAYASVSAFAFNSATNVATFNVAGVAHSATVTPEGIYGITVSASADPVGGLLLTGVVPS